MSFGWTILFRTGSWLEFRNFALNQRKNATSRITMINSELAKIGFIRVLYERTDTSNNLSKMSEKRIGLEISANSSLCKLLQAYVMKGGNPFDISMFLIPDSYTLVEDADGEEQISETQPYSGILAPQTDENQEVQGDISTAGWIPLWKYPPRKMGSKVSIWGIGKEVSVAVTSARKWISQEIKELRNDLETRIIKLCDLREQLLKERDELIVGAMGGVTKDILFNADAYSSTHHLSYITNTIDKEIFPNLTDAGERDFSKPRQDNSDVLYPTIVADAPNDEEKWSAL
jgi:hypothetical protein